MVFLTSNNTRELSEGAEASVPLPPHRLSRCRTREGDRAGARAEVDDALAEQIAKVVGSIRNLDLKKAPSISETIDWARTLVYLGSPTRSRPS